MGVYTLVENVNSKCKNSYLVYQTAVSEQKQVGEGKETLLC